MKGDDPRDRILSEEDMAHQYGRPRKHTVTFTNGCFDLLHRGHISLLYRARALGHHLLVAINSDRSLRRLKGPGRPVLPAEDRALLLASLRFVDAVTIFDADTPLELIRAILPDHLVKGADYRRENVIGADVVEAAGGQLHLLPLVEKVGTGVLIRRAVRALQDSEDPPGSER